MEHFIGILHVTEVDAQAITQTLVSFLDDKGIPMEGLRGLGFDGTNTMSGERSGVQKRMRYHSPSALYVHYRCHQLQLAAVHSANDHNEVRRIFGTLLTIWKPFIFLPKKLRS